MLKVVVYKKGASRHALDLIAYSEAHAHYAGKREDEFKSRALWDRACALKSYYELCARYEANRIIAGIE